MQSLSSTRHLFFEAISVSHVPLQQSNDGDRSESPGLTRRIAFDDSISGGQSHDQGFVNLSRVASHTFPDVARQQAGSMLKKRFGDFLFDGLPHRMNNLTRDIGIGLIGAQIPNDRCGFQEHLCDAGNQIRICDNSPTIFEEFLPCPEFDPSYPLGAVKAVYSPEVEPCEVFLLDRLAALVIHDNLAPGHFPDRNAGNLVRVKYRERRCVIDSIGTLCPEMCFDLATRRDDESVGFQLELRRKQINCKIHAVDAFSNYRGAELRKTLLQPAPNLAQAVDCELKSPYGDKNVSALGVVTSFEEPHLTLRACRTSVSVSSAFPGFMNMN